ncbi:MAG: hypothetical protein QM755_13640 [Luteolibacter sp.]
MDISIMSDAVVSKSGAGGAFRRLWWLALIVTPVMMFVGLFCGGVIAYVMPKKYDSVAVINVAPASGQSVGVDDARAALAIEVMRSSGCLGRVSEKLELPNRWGLPKQDAIDVLRSATMIHHDAGTGIFRITIRHTNKEDARDAADELANTYRTMMEEENPKQNVVTIIDRPVMAMYVSSPKVPLILGSGAGIGLLVGLLVSWPVIALAGRRPPRQPDAPPRMPEKNEPVTF